MKFPMLRYRQCKLTANRPNDYSCLRPFCSDDDDDGIADTSPVESQPRFAAANSRDRIDA